MMQEEMNTIGAFLRARIASSAVGTQIYEYGVVESCNGDVVQVKGLGHTRYGEMLAFENDAFGLAFDLREDGVAAVMLSGENTVKTGSIVRGTGEVASVCVGEELLGRVIDPLGRALDGKPLKTKKTRPVEAEAPAIMDRAPVNEPLETGILAIDSMIPIGRGQRELIIGDRQTGKTQIALSTIVHQARRESGMICIYCAIGQKAASVSGIVRMLEREGALANTIVISAASNDCAALQYLAPYAACAVAEEFMYEGRDVLVVYDDLSKHAVAYRAMSLLLRRPAGREAYPGDVFYLHSRLLERAAHLSAEKGGGSMTALPIVETMANDISAYIPTNVISITDGQIYLETELFHAGVRPAVNVGLSVSRVGRSAQHDAMKKVSGAMRLDISQYRDLAAFARFGSDIDATTAALLQKGACLMELLKQPLSEDFSLAEQTALLYAAGHGAFRTLPVSRVRDYKRGFLAYLAEHYPQTMARINETGVLDDVSASELARAAETFTLA